MNRWAVVCCLLLSLSLTVSANELSFSDAVSLMQEQSTPLRIAELNWEVAQLDYERAMATNLMTDSQSGRMQAQLDLERARQNHRSAGFNQRLDLFRKYTDVLAAQRLAEIRRLERELAQGDYQVVQEKIRMGDVGRLDELREINLLESALRAEKAAEQSLQEKQRLLAQALGLSVPPSPVGNFNPPVLDISLARSIELGLENSFELFERRSALELQEMQIQRQGVDGTAPLELRRAKLNLEIAQLNQLVTQANLVEQITSSYVALEQSLSRLEGSRREVEISRESYEISRRQAQVGLITERQLRNANLNLLRAINASEELLVGSIISAMQFYRLIGLDGDLP